MREARQEGIEESTEDHLPLDEARKLVELLKESGVAEIHIKRGDVEVSVKAMPEAPQAVSFPEADRYSETEVSPEANGFHAVRSPLVGTFYRSPAPNEGPYIEVGDRVEVGQTVCIVEAMKLMNEIPSDVSGEVVEVLVENSEGVEYDQPLFHLRPEE